MNADVNTSDNRAPHLSTLRIPNSNNGTQASPYQLSSNQYKKEQEIKQDRQPRSLPPQDKPKWTRVLNYWGERAKRLNIQNSLAVYGPLRSPCVLIPLADHLVRQRLYEECIMKYGYN